MDDPGEGDHPDGGEGGSGTGATPADADAASAVDRARERVPETYDRIAGHFAATRAHPWPEVEAFLEGRTGAVAADVGCGNGRHAALLADRAARVVCLDASRELLRVARDRLAAAVGAESGDRPTDTASVADDAGPAAGDVALVAGDAGALPLRSGSVDLGLYVATLHHLPSRGERVASLDELARVLAPGGRALVSAWSTAHDRFDRREGFDTTVPWTLPGGETVSRFYHIYDPGEFRADLGESDLRVLSTEVASGNCYATVGPPD